MSDVTNIINVVEDVAERFNSQLSSTEKKLLDEVLNLVKDLNVTNGRINSSVENLRLLSKIKSKLKRVILNKDYLKNVRELIKGMDQILAAQVSYFNKDFHVSKDFKGKSELVKQLAIENTVNMLAGTGIEANVTNKINEMLLRSITSGGKYADLVKEMSNFLTTSENGDGALTRYAQTWTNTSLNQFAGQHNKLMTDDLGIEWYMYVGSNKDTTREFCELLKEKKYVHKSEIPEIVKGRIDGYQCEIYERTGLPKGMIAGTTAENFMVNCGGWNCGHKLVPVNEAAVPKEVRERVEKTNKSVKEINRKLNKIRELERFSEKKDFINLGILDFVPTSDVITRKLLEFPTSLLKQKFLKEIIQDDMFKEYLHGIESVQLIGKTYIFEKRKYTIEELSIAKDLNVNKRDVALLPETGSGSKADAITIFKNKYVVAELKYSTTTKESTLKKDIRKGFIQSNHIVLKTKNGDLGMIERMFDEFIRKRWKLGNITIINEYGKLKDVEEKDIRTGKYLKALKGFL